MSQENIRLVRQAFQALDRDGPTGLLPFLDSGIEWISIPDFLPDARDYHGHDGVLRWFAKIGEIASDTTWQLEEIVEAGNPMVVVSTISGSGKSSGTPIQITVFHVITVANGKALRFESYLTRVDALKAARPPA
jgi:ketosteroid isomerase-like protein